MVAMDKRMYSWGGKIMRSVDRASAITGALAVALMLTAVGGPVAAGPVCNALDLGSRCATSSDIRSSIVLGGSGENGRLRVRNEDNDTAVELRGSTGNVTNLFSNLENESNGLVKAWAQINPDGTVAACWRCNTDTGETRRLNNGEYEVDFTPLATDITGRPRSATIDAGSNAAPVTIITLEDRSGDPSSVFVDATDLADVLTDSPFVLIIY
jgi:hypothetical protein